MTSSHDVLQSSKIETIYRSSVFAFRRQADGSLSATLASGMTHLEYVLRCSEEKNGCVYARLMTPVVIQPIADPDAFCSRITMELGEGRPNLFFDHQKKCFCWEMEVRVKRKKFKGVVNVLVVHCDVLTGIICATVADDGTWDPHLVGLAATPVESMH
jgi:hypothetical protein